jgi:hypothetical protein
MSKIDDGGPAFPSTSPYLPPQAAVYSGDQGWPHAPATAYPAFPTVSYPGMTLRDWFAGQALAGVMASPHIADHAGTNKTDAEFVSGLAMRSYMLADAMLAERLKAGGE